MKDVTIYHNPRCSTSRSALAQLREAGIEPRIVEYLKSPPSRDELRAIAAANGSGVRGLLRRKEALYGELGLDDPTRSDEALLDAMLAHPSLIERPIVVTGRGARVCRPPERLREILP
ncbi:MAG: arsenate reductase (glutaredoxin) [Rhodocyclaceae bacterium]|jgi:arsenate reductase|nr:arsenate reductase (glutaredoxin) [Rhodocyclaceae bacterium]